MQPIPDDAYLCTGIQSGVNPIVMGLQQQQLALSSGHFNHYYLCHYRPQSAGADRLSSSLLRFKRGVALDITAWISCSLSILNTHDFPTGLLILRALQSDEESVRDSTPLDSLCEALAKLKGGNYLPGCLTKSRKTKPLKLLPLNERGKELEHVYSFLPPAGIVVNDILLIDDIFTSGTTISTLIDAIRLALPTCSIQVFTLATSDRQSTLNSVLKLTSTSYTWESTLGWQLVGEELIMTEFQQLESMILNDSFH